MSEQDNPVPKSGVIRRLFNRLSAGVPRTPGQTAKMLARGVRAYLVIPFTLKGAFAAVAFSITVPAATTPVLFPTAQDWLTRNGLDPTIADELAPGRTIYVREKNFFGTAHALFDKPLFFGLTQLNLLSPYNAYNLPDDIFGNSKVVLPSRDITAKELIAGFTNIPADKIETLPFTDEQAFYAIAFHELRHASRVNMAQPADYLIEADADLEGVGKAAEVFDNPQLRRAFMYMRALSLEASHDGTLEQDRVLNGTDTILRELGGSASEEAAIYMEKYYDGNVGKINLDAVVMDVKARTVDVFKAYDAFGAALEKHGHQMSPNAKRRAELFREALEYFVPSVRNAAPQPAAPQP